MTTAGQLRDPIYIQRKTGGKDAWGTPLPEAWESITAKPIWSNFRFQSGSESIRSGADVSIVRASARIRWRTGIDPGMRVLFGTQVFDIEAVLPSGDRKHVDLVCRLLPVLDAPAANPEPKLDSGNGGWG